MGREPRTEEREGGGLLERLRALEGRPAGPPRMAPDAVNDPMIRHWCEAMGDRNPVYSDRAFAERSVHGGIVAPPTMLQAWTMKGLVPPPPSPEDAQAQLVALLDDAGFTSVVATNSEQEYVRYLRPGDVLTATSVIESVSEAKSTALGPGHFFTTLTTYRDQTGAVVGWQRFRLLKFRPPEVPEEPAAGPARRPRPAINQDTAFFWEGVRRGELLIQRCAGCGRLRHPPRPACPWCRSLEWGSVPSSGRGEVYSYVVHHHPPIPGFEVPYVVALVQLAEGTRLVAGLVDSPPEGVRIGMPVRVRFVAVDDDLTLPMFGPAG